MSKTLTIGGSGVITAVGLNNEQTCAAIRAKITGFAESDHHEDRVNPDPLLAAHAPSRPRPKDEPMGERLLGLAASALGECLREAKTPPGRTAVLVGMREAYRKDPDFDDLAPDFLNKLELAVGMEFSPGSRVFRDGNAAVFVAIQHARDMLMSGAVEVCIVGGVDSYLSVDDLIRFEDVYRLKRKGVPQGFIPGEGAAFLALSRKGNITNAEPLGEILGVGLAREATETTVLAGADPTGIGLLRALEATLEDAGLAESQIDFRISDLNGEIYRGLESMFALSRFYRTVRREMPIWLPAASVGEIGAASGALSIIVACTGMARNYAPGPLAMCEASADSGLRAGCLVSMSKSQL